MVKILIAPIIILTILLLAPGNAEGNQVLNIGLTRFEAIPLDNAVQIEWDTETELGTAGYRLKRGQGGTYAYLMDPNGNGSLFVLSEGGPSIGANYSVVDGTAVNGESYTYQLVEVTTDGLEAVQAEVTVTAGAVPTNTPIVLGGGGDGNDNRDTATPEPTATTVATIAATSIASKTSIPTPTNIPTVVRTATAQPVATSVRNGLPTDETELPPANAANTAVESETIIPDLELEQPITSGVAVAQALEESTAVELELSPQSGTSQSSPETQSAQSAEEINTIANTAADDSLQPVVIGKNLKSGAEGQPNTLQGNQQSEPSTDSFAGRVYLWIAFVAAIVIFIASVIGAILLYTRRRNKD